MKMTVALLMKMPAKQQITWLHIPFCIYTYHCCSLLAMVNIDKTHRHTHAFAVHNITNRFAEHGSNEPKIWMKQKWVRLAYKWRNVSKQRHSNNKQRLSKINENKWPRKRARSARLAPKKRSKLKRMWRFAYEWHFMHMIGSVHHFFRVCLRFFLFIAFASFVDELVIVVVGAVAVVALYSTLCFISPPSALATIWIYSLSFDFPSGEPPVFDSIERIVLLTERYLHFHLSCCVYLRYVFYCWNIIIVHFFLASAPIKLFGWLFDGGSLFVSPHVSGATPYIHGRMFFFCTGGPWCASARVPSRLCVFLLVYYLCIMLLVLPRNPCTANIFDSIMFVAAFMYARLQRTPQCLLSACEIGIRANTVWYGEEWATVLAPFICVSLLLADVAESPKRET